MEVWNLSFLNRYWQRFKSSEMLWRVVTYTPPDVLKVWFYTFIDILYTFNVKLHTQTLLSLSTLSTAHKHNSSGQLLQDYYFAAQDLEVHCVKETGFANKVLLIFLTTSFLTTCLTEIRLAYCREFKRKFINSQQTICLTDNSSLSADTITWHNLKNWLLRHNMLIFL